MNQMIVIQDLHCHSALASHLGSSFSPGRHLERATCCAPCTRQTLLLARDLLIDRGLQAAMLHDGAGCHACQEQRQPLTGPVTTALTTLSLWPPAAQCLYLQYIRHSTEETAFRCLWRWKAFEVSWCQTWAIARCQAEWSFRHRVVTCFKCTLLHQILTQF